MSSRLHRRDGSLHDGFILQPNVYGTERYGNLLSILEQIWMRSSISGEGEYYLLSGFGNYNGGVRFFSTFRQHTDNGGRVVAFFGASSSQRLTSRQLVERMLACNCEVYLINRRRIFHSKCYGVSNNYGEKLVVTSGNFTGPGMSHNVEASVYLDNELTAQINFNWETLSQSILEQQWEIYRPTLEDPDEPAWDLLYNEHESRFSLDESQLMTIVLTLGHADTARICAEPGTNAGKGSQYFWLSKDCYDFFPPLTILNERGHKTTNSCLINLHYVDLEQVHNTRVTFEADNNADFRLGTGKYRYTKKARRGDLAVLNRISENNYEIRIIRQESREFSTLNPYATTFIGSRGKRIGYLSNDRFESVTGISLPSVTQFERL